MQVTPVRNHKMMNMVLIAAGILYWALFAFSSGMIEYYQDSVSAVLSNSLKHAPIFIYYGNIHFFLIYGGLYWFPTYHVGITFPVMQFTLSVILAVMFSLVLGDMIKSKGTRIVKKNSGMSLGWSLFSLISTTGGCCSLPFIYYILSIVTSTSASFGVTLFFSSYSYVIDMWVIAALIIFHLRNKKTSHTLSVDCNFDGN